MKNWVDRYWTGRDGLELHYRDYEGPTDRPPLLLLHGLTRNARDFAHVADRYAGDWRVMAVDFRGRGNSAFDPQPERYQPPTYAQDVLELLAETGVDKAVFIGTSLGGLVTMIVAALERSRIAGALLNDVGPELGDVGIDRILDYVGKPVRFDSWEDAAGEFSRRHGAVHSAYGPDDWIAYARRVCRQGEGGIELDYDMRIAEAFQQAAEPAEVDTWALYRLLGGTPLTIVRGADSDLLNESIARRMVDEVEDAELVTVPGVGHAPDLGEPEAVGAIDRLLDRVLSSRG